MTTDDDLTVADLSLIEDILHQEYLEVTETEEHPSQGSYAMQVLHVRRRVLKLRADKIKAAQERLVET